MHFALLFVSLTLSFTFVFFFVFFFRTQLLPFQRPDPQCLALRARCQRTGWCSACPRTPERRIRVRLCPLSPRLWLLPSQSQAVGTSWSGQWRSSGARDTTAASKAPTRPLVLWWMDTPIRLAATPTPLTSAVIMTLSLRTLIWNENCRSWERSE